MSRHLFKQNIFLFYVKEMVWQIRHGFDLEGGQELLGLRFPFLKMQMFVDPSHEFPPEVKAVMERDRMAESFEVAKTLKSPRLAYLSRYC